MYWKVKNLNKVVYRIGYQYRQISLIHYWLSEYRLNSTPEHHYLQMLYSRVWMIPNVKMFSLKWKFIAQNWKLLTNYNFFIFLYNAHFTLRTIFLSNGLLYGMTHVAEAMAIVVMYASSDWTITQHSVCALLGTKTMSGEEEVYHILQKYHLFFQCLCFMTAGQDGTYFGKQPVKTWY